MIAKLAAIALLFVIVMLSSMVDAQATVLTAGSSGSTTVVQGIVISNNQFNDANDIGKYAPFTYTSAEVAAATTSDIVLVHTNGQSALPFEWNVIWNFNTAESNTIRNYMSGLTLRSNLEVRFTATWDGSGRFAIDTSSWTFVYQSLFPYGMSNCNASANVMDNRQSQSTLPASCVGTLVPGQKSLAQSTPGCLAMHGRKAVELADACATVRAFLETVYCTDGSVGVDDMCSYNEAFLPSGVANADSSVVVTVGADGLPTSGRLNQQTPPPGPPADSAPVITAGASGTTTAVQGIAISKSQFNDAAGIGKYAPYTYTSAEVAAAVESDLVLVFTNSQGASAFEWNVIWNFTTAESNTIRSYMGGLTLRSNLEVRFTATWDGSGRFAIDTSSWTFVYQSLLPYGMDNCNASAIAMGARLTLSTLPDNCIGTLVPGQKALAQSTPGCLAMHGRTAVELVSSCATVRAFLETVYCTDGSVGVDAVCSYNKAFLPSGEANADGTVVVTVGTDGLATAGRKDQQNPPAGSAGSVLSAIVAIVAVIVSMMM